MEAAVNTPGARFARGVVADAAAGMALRDLVIEDEPEALRLRVTMAGGERAREHVLRFSGVGDRAVAYGARAVGVPREARVYPAEAELLRFLALAPPNRLFLECADYYLESGDAGLTLDPQDYYTAAGRTVGAAAPAAWRRQVLAALAARMELSAVTAEAGPGRGRVVEMVFDGDERRSIRADLDAQGRIGAVEVRTGPRAMQWQVYTRHDALRRALRGADLRDLRAIEVVDVSEAGDAEEAGGTGVEGASDASVVLVGAKRFRIDLRHFEPGDLYCGC